MRRALVPLFLGFTLGFASLIEAKFGVSKTKVILSRVRPPELTLLGDTVAVEVKAGSPDVSAAHVALVRGRLQDALRPWNLYRLVERAREADVVVRVTIQDLRAEVRDEVRIEKKYVKVGERQEWDEKKKKMVTKDVYAYRDQPVSVRIAEGSVSALVEVEGPGGPRTRDAGASYHRQFDSHSVPPEATTEEALRYFLVSGAANEAVAAVAYSPDPVEALLAVDGELKPGNHLAERGLWSEALQEWSRRAFKGDKEAARLHNVGVAHEALAYRLPPDTPEHRSHLEQAREHYLKAMALDPGEKYFRDPPQRVEASLSYAAGATSYMAELQQFRDDSSRRRASAGEPVADRAPRPSVPAGRTKPAEVKPPSEPKAALSGSASLSTPLRNGSFESSLAPWTVAGKGAVVEEKGRGRVLEVVPASQGAEVRQTVGVDIEKEARAGLSLDYKVTSGEARIRVLVTYADAVGRERTSTLEVTAGEGPGAWAPWTGDVDTLRPRPARVTGLRIAVEGGTVRLDNVALTVSR